MENEAKTISKPTQPLTQAPNQLPIQTPQSNKGSKFLMFSVLGLIVISSSLFIGIQIGKNQTPNQQLFVAQPTVSQTQTMTTPTVIPTQTVTTDVPLTTTPKIDPTTSWKTYTSAKYSFKYPSVWIVDEKCTKLGYPTSNPCIYSSDYHRVTKKVEPGDGGGDTVTEYNVGTLLYIDLLENVAYNSNGFCSPGGPSSIDNCHEKTINGNRYALREIGSYPYPTTSINSWLLINNNGVIDLSFSFSKANKVTDLQLFDQILSTLKFVN